MEKEKSVKEQAEQSLIYSTIGMIIFPLLSILCLFLYNKLSLDMGKVLFYLLAIPISVVGLLSFGMVVACVGIGLGTAIAWILNDGFESKY